MSGDLYTALASSPWLYRRFGIACCRRIYPVLRDSRLKKALTRLENSLETPDDDRLRRNAYNTANAAYWRFVVVVLVPK